MRRLVAETRLHPAELVLPLFVARASSEPVPVSSMPGVVQHTRDSLRKAAVEAVEAGVGGMMLFGVPEAQGRRRLGRTDPDGILQRGHPGRASPRSATTLVVMSDLCLDEYTDHGHCGVLDARRPGRQRRDPGAVRRDGAWSRPTPGVARGRALAG